MTSSDYKCGINRFGHCECNRNNSLCRLYVFCLLITLSIYWPVWSQTKKRIPSVSYKNILSCYPELKSNQLEKEIRLNDLKKQLDLKYDTLKSVMRYRRVVFHDVKSVESSLASNSSETGSSSSLRKRIMISLSQFKNNTPEYKMSLELLDAQGVGEEQSLPKKHEINPTKDIIQSYLINAQIEDDESMWVDTKTDKKELSYKKINEVIFELDFVDTPSKKTLRCENKKEAGVLCLCLKRYAANIH